MTSHCKGCGKPFETDRAYQFYCSERCRKAAFKKRERAARAARRPNKPKGDEPVEISPREILDQDALDHFNLQEDPFMEVDDPEEIFLPPRLQRVEKLLTLVIERHQIVVLCGEPGSGKSTLVRRLYGRMARQKRVRLISPASLDRRRVTHAALSVAIIRDLTGRDTSSLSMEARSELLRKTLEAQDGAGIYPALVIDEAHLLSNDALLALKQVWDSHTMFAQLAIILVGQPGLEARLRHDPAVREITGRAQILDLKPLGNDTGDYLRWRFAQVRANADDVFEPGAYDAIAARAEHPLWINNLAIRAMTHAWQKAADKVSAVHVGRV